MLMKAGPSGAISDARLGGDVGRVGRAVVPRELELQRVEFHRAERDADRDRNAEAVAHGAGNRDRLVILRRRSRRAKRARRATGQKRHVALGKQAALGAGAEAEVERHPQSSGGEERREEAVVVLGCDDQRAFVERELELGLAGIEADLGGVDLRDQLDGADFEMRVAVRRQDERAIRFVGDGLKPSAGTDVRRSAQRPSDRENLLAEDGHIDHRRRVHFQQCLPSLAQRSLQRAASAERDEHAGPALRRAQKIKRGVDPLLDGLAVRVALGGEEHRAEQAPRDRVGDLRAGFGRGVPAVERAVVFLKGKGEERRERHEVEVRALLCLLFVVERDEDGPQQVKAAVGADFDDVAPGDLATEEGRDGVFDEARRVCRDEPIVVAQANVIEREQIQKAVRDFANQRRAEAE